MRVSTRHGYLGLWLSVTLLGCGGSDAVSAASTHTTAGTSAGGSTATADVIGYRHRNHGGVIRLIAVSLQELDLTPGQKAKLEGLRSDLVGKMEPGRAAGRDLATVLADGVAAGAVDPGKAELAAARLGEANAGLRAAMTDGLNRRHAVLTPDQRAALIAKMQVLWAKWQEEWQNAEADLPTNDMAVLTEKLGLSQEQVSRIEARFAGGMRGVVAEYSPRGVAARAQAFGSRFTTDGFDAAAAEPGSVAPPTGFGATRMTRFFEAFAPELNPAQRTVLAQAIRDHESRHDQP